MDLSELIIQKIKRSGPISFREFMEICLYYPGLGYYTSTHDRIGTDGDFYTSATFTPAFGMTIARQIEEMWRHLGGEIFTIVEYGAGTGILCRDILSALKRNRQMYEQLQYRIIERSPVRETKEKNDLPEKVTFHSSIDEFTIDRGCILSNELLDNFSVHKVVMEDELKEVFIDYQDGFIETVRSAGRELNDYLLEIGIELPKGFQAEINLQVITWIGEVANAMNKGYVLTIDYGYPSKELYKQQRSSGTLLGYYRHSVTDNLYTHIGQQDITSHVNFSALSHWGIKNGLSDCGFTDQCHFLLSLGVQDVVKKIASREDNLISAARKASMLNHILLREMGSKFKVLIQEKGGCNKDLSGLKITCPEAL
jgi:SAM-dependent MidA family methyltransferase